MSLDNLYTHAGSSCQQMVVAVLGVEEKTTWLVKPSHESGSQNFAGKQVRRGDVIRLEHVVTRRNLHSHPNVPAPVDRSQQEITAFGENGFGDPNDNWVFEPEAGDVWESDRPFRLIHKATKVALHSHKTQAPIFTAGYQEVTGFSQRDERDLWICRAEDQPANPNRARRDKTAALGLAGLVVAVIAMIFQITGPIPSEVLAAMPAKLSRVLQPVARFLSDYGSFVALGVVVALGVWKRRLVVRAYVEIGAFLLRPILHHVDRTQLQITRADYGALGNTTDVKHALRALVKENRLTTKVNNDELGVDPAPGHPKQLKVEYVYFGDRRTVTVSEGETLKLPV